MDAIIKAEVYEYSAYLTTGDGKVYRVFFRGEPYPLIELLTSPQISEFEAHRRKRDQR